MPTYEYVCTVCGHAFDELQAISAKPLLVCPNCGRDTLERGPGGGSGMIFKGSGFYLTDYKGEKKSGEKESKPEKKESGSEKKESSPEEKKSSPDKKDSPPPAPKKSEDK